MPRTLVRDLRPHVGQQVTVYGWVNTLRLQRKIQFVLVRDHTDMVQVTHKRSDGGSVLDDLIEHEMPIESAVKVTGTVVDNKVVNLGGSGPNRRSPRATPPSSPALTRRSRGSTVLRT